MSNTLPNRLRQAAQYTGLDGLRELLIEAADTMDSSEPAAWTTSSAIFSFQRRKFNAAMMMPSPDGLKDPVALYTAPQPKERKPLTTQQIADANGLEIIDPYVLVAIAITRNAEKVHGINGASE